jgi:hypothetical protein
MRLVHAVFASLIIARTAVAQTQVSTENAYNPIPSPDGRKIVAARTGWFRPGGSGGLGRSNLQSDVIVLDRTGRTLKTLGEGFVADWKKEGIVLFRDWSYSLRSEDGSTRGEGRTCPQEILPASASECMERVAYLSTLGRFVWIRQKWGDSVLVTPEGEFSPHYKEKFLGEWLAPSADERYIAAGPGRLGKSLTIYDSREKVWHDLGPAVIHPDADWTWMEPSWNPWFADGSHLVFFTSDGLTVSTPDGKQRRVLVRPEEPAGLAVPSPDGRAIAYATFAGAPRPNGAGTPPTFHTTGIWIVHVEAVSQPRRLTGPTVSSTYDLRWLDNQHLVFDRSEQLRLPKAQLWMVAADR